MRYVFAPLMLASLAISWRAAAADTTVTGHPKSLPDGAAFHREAENVAAAPGAVPLQEFRLPVELGQGLGYKKGDQGLNYEAALRALPTFGYGRWDFSLDLSLLYRNASLDAGLGGRIDDVFAVFYQVVRESGDGRTVDVKIRELRRCLAKLDAILVSTGIFAAPGLDVLMTAEDYRPDAGDDSP